MRTIHDMPQRTIVDILQEACNCLGISYQKDLNPKFKDMKLKINLVYLCCLYGIQGKENDFKQLHKYAKELVERYPYVEKQSVICCLCAFSVLKCRKLCMPASMRNELIDICTELSQHIQDYKNEMIRIIGREKIESTKEPFIVLKKKMKAAIRTCIVTEELILKENTIRDFLVSYIGKPCYPATWHYFWDDAVEQKLSDIQFKTSAYRCFCCMCDLILKQYSEVWAHDATFKPKLVRQNLSSSFSRLEEKEVTSSVFLVRTNVSMCAYKNHPLVDLIGLVKVIDQDGTVITVKIPIGYCKKCDKYYILQTDYAFLGTKGTIICKNTEIALRKSDSDTTFDLTNSQSILRAYGYTVNAQDNLSMRERHRILTKVIDEKILTKIEVCSHLDWLINRSRTQPQLVFARQKWIADRKFIANYKNEELGVVEISSIERNYYK